MCDLCVGQAVAAGVVEAAVGVSVAEAGADDPHLPQGVKLTQTAARHTGHRTQLGQIEPQSRETGRH